MSAPSRFGSLPSDDAGNGLCSERLHSIAESRLFGIDRQSDVDVGAPSHDLLGDIWGDSMDAAFC